MRRLALFHHLVALSAVSGLLLPAAGLAEQAPVNAGAADQAAVDQAPAGEMPAPTGDGQTQQAPTGEAPAEQAPAPEPVKARQSGTEEYSSTISEVDACNRAQNLTPENATVTAMHVSTKVTGEYATFTCRVKWSLSPSARPTDRPILFSPSA